MYLVSDLLCICFVRVPPLFFRALDTMDKWDLEKLTSVVNEKDTSKKTNETQIVCKFFLDALETKKYGWFWNCPNGPTCIYKHALPPGFVLKSDKVDADEEEDFETLVERIERERAALDSTKLTPLTEDLFAKWREEEEVKRKDKVEVERKQAAKKGNKGMGVLSGRALFEFDASLFADDENAADEKEMEIQTDDEEEGAEPKKPSGPIDASLFGGDIDLPSDDSDGDA